jgi:hypothetical protein
MRRQNEESNWSRLTSWWHSLLHQMMAVFDPYRPELHYMRGRGPRWREKHAHRFSVRRMD